MGLSFDTKYVCFGKLPKTRNVGLRILVECTPFDGGTAATVTPKRRRFGCWYNIFLKALKILHGSVLAEFWLNKGLSKYLSLKTGDGKKSLFFQFLKCSLRAYFAQIKLIFVFCVLAWPGLSFDTKCIRFGETAKKWKCWVTVHWSCVVAREDSLTITHFLTSLFSY